MLGDLLKRVVNGAVLFIAVLAFFRVPIGSKTAAEHTVAIFTTPPAREAGSAVAGAARDIAGRVMAEVERARHGEAPARAAPEAPSAKPSAGP